MIMFMVAFMAFSAYADIASVSYVDENVSALNDTIAFKPDDSDVVHRTGTETISGEKTFKNRIRSEFSGAVFDADRILLNAGSNPYLKLSGESQGVNYFIQVFNDLLYVGPTYSKAMSVDYSTGDVSIPASLNVSGAITVNSDVHSGSDSNTVATTKWTNDKIDAARGKIPSGGENAAATVTIWVE